MMAVDLSGTQYIRKIHRFGSALEDCYLAAADCRRRRRRSSSPTRNADNDGDGRLQQLTVEQHEPVRKEEEEGTGGLTALVVALPRHRADYNDE
jgi:hypothetical protein